MRIGVIGYLSKTGIGIMVNDFAEKVGAVAQLVASHDTAEDLKPSNNRSLIHCKTWCPTRDEVAAFEELIDVAVTVESDWGGEVFPRLREKKVKIVLIPMFEWWNEELPMNEYVDLFICTTKQCYEGIPFKNKVFIPCPVDTKKIYYRQRTGKPKTFIHNAGNLGIGGRKGTLETVRAFTKVTNHDLRLYVTSQIPLPSNIEQLIISDERIRHRVKNFDNYEELYVFGDVLIYTPHYDGQALVSAEAMAAGFPVISINAPPMNEHWKIYSESNGSWESAGMLVPVKRTVDAETINPSSVKNCVDEDKLAGTIELAASMNMDWISRKNREIAEKAFSWDVCLPFYKHYLNKVIYGGWR